MHGALRETLVWIVWNSMWNEIGNHFHIFHKVLALEVIFRKYVQKVACFSGAFGLLYSYTIDPSIRTAI